MELENIEKENGEYPLPAKLVKINSEVNLFGSKNQGVDSELEIVDNRLKSHNQENLCEIKQENTHVTQNNFNISEQNNGVITHCIINHTETNFVDNATKLKESLTSNNMPQSYRQTYNAFLDKVISMEVPILDSFEKETLVSFKYFNERYFENYYCINSTNFGKDTVSNDMLIRVHSNKLVLLSLARSHYVRCSNTKIKDVNYIVNNTDRSVIKTKGKRKYGSKAIEPNTILCQIKLQGSDDFVNIRAGVSGYLIEMNELIKNDPNLLINEPTALGYLGIIFPKGKPDKFKNVIQSWGLLSEESYINHLKQLN